MLWFKCYSAKPSFQSAHAVFATLVFLCVATQHSASATFWCPGADRCGRGILLRPQYSLCSADGNDEVCTAFVLVHRVFRGYSCGKCIPDDIKYSLEISDPLDGFKTDVGSISIVGSVTPPPAEGAVAKVKGFEGEISASSGDFFIESVVLSEGFNELTVRAYESNTVVASGKLSGTFTRPSEATSDVAPETGGKAEVTNEESELFGASIDIPAGAALRSLAASVIYDENAAMLPFGKVAVGPPAIFAPEAETFTGNVFLTLPFSPSDIPNGKTPQDVRILGYADDGWVEVPATLEGNDRLKISTGALELGPFVAFVDQPLEPGQIAVDTSPGFATIYLDGARVQSRTPVVLENVTVGSHQLKLYLPGFNEVFHNFESTLQGATVQVDLGTPANPIPVVQMADGLDGLVVPSSVFEVTANVTLDGIPLDSGKAVITVRNEDSVQNVESGGTIAGYITLSPGKNDIEVRVNGPNGSTGVSESISITRNNTAPAVASISGIQPSQKMDKKRKKSHGRLLANQNELVIRLSWNTNATDLDLHVFDPSGNHASWTDKLGIPGGEIDVDDTDGYGPEVFTLNDPPSGQYRVAVDSYDIMGVPTTGTITISIGSTSKFTDSYLFTASDYDDTDGSPTGADPKAFWDTHTFEIGELLIIDVSTHKLSSSLDEAVFTTVPGENMIEVKTQFPDGFSESSIKYHIKEVNEGFEVDTSSLSGSTVDFEVAHKPLEGLTNPAKSTPLEYEIVAYTLDGSGNRDLESPGVRIKQDKRSQIRQEFIDKREFLPDFKRETPRREVILDAGQFVKGDGNFVFTEFNQWSDFGPGLAIIQDALHIANTMRDAWGHPLRVARAFRNPRRNDATVGAVTNSFHQTGDAIALNPSWQKSNWPASVPGCLDPPGKSIQTYAEAQAALTCLAGRTLDLTIYDYVFESGHLHIERDTAHKTTLDLQDVPDKYKPFFKEAGKSWDRVVVGDVPDVTVNAAVQAFSNCARVPDSIDDLFVCSTVTFIDGAGSVVGGVLENILGGTLVEEERASGENVIPYLAHIELDEFDVDNMVTGGTFENVIRHEFGHALGYGSVWDQNDLLGTDSCSYLNDTFATKEWRALSGCESAIPVETGYGPGTECSHWEEACMKDELMTGINTGANPLSRMTIASLQDIGYQVDYHQADPFPKSELDPSCTCSGTTRRGIRGLTTNAFDHSRSKEQPGEGIVAAAVAYGKQRLKEHKPLDAGRLPGTMNGNSRGQTMFVLVMDDNGQIFDIAVRADEDE